MYYILYCFCKINRYGHSPTGSDLSHHFQNFQTFKPFVCIQLCVPVNMAFQLTEHIRTVNVYSLDSGETAI